MVALPKHVIVSILCFYLPQFLLKLRMWFLYHHVHGYLRVSLPAIWELLLTKDTARGVSFQFSVSSSNAEAGRIEGQMTEV